MKKFFLMGLMSLAFALNGFSQDVQNVVKINPLGALFGSANVAYERALNEHSSIMIAPSFGFLKSAGLKYTTYGIGAEYRFYFGKTKSAPEGFYAGPGVGYNLGQVKNDGEGGSKTSISGVNGKAIFGHQWIWDSGFSLDLNGGVQYVNYKFSDDDFIGEPLSGILPTLGFSIGYAF